MPRINTAAESAIFNINQAQGRYAKSSSELSTGNRNLSRDITSSIMVGQLDNRSQTISKVRQGLIYMKNMFATAHTGTKNLLSNLVEQQNLIRAAGGSNSQEVLTQLKSALDSQMASFDRIVRETNFDGRALLNGFGAAGDVGSLGVGTEPIIPNVIHVLHSNARMGVNMDNTSDFTIAPLVRSQIYIDTNHAGITNLFRAAILKGDGLAAAEAAVVGAAAAGIVARPAAIEIDTPANRTIAETVTNCARTIVSAQNAKIETYLAIIEDAMNSLGEDLITNNSVVASLANTDYMQSSEESKNALQAMLSGMAVLSTFQGQLNRAILEVIKS